MPEAWTVNMKKWEEGSLDFTARVVCHWRGGMNERFPSMMCLRPSSQIIGSMYHYLVSSVSFL